MEPLQMAPTSLMVQIRSLCGRQPQLLVSSCCPLCQVFTRLAPPATAISTPLQRPALNTRTKVATQFKTYYLLTLTLTHLARQQSIRAVSPQNTSSVTTCPLYTQSLELRTVTRTSVHVHTHTQSVESENWPATTSTLKRWAWAILCQGQKHLGGSGGPSYKGWKTEETLGVECPFTLGDTLPPKG